MTSSSGPPPTNFLLPNGTFFVELLIFLLVLFVFWRWIVPPVSRSLQEREDMVRQTINDSEEASRKLRAAEELYTEALDEARREATKIRAAARAEGARIREEFRARAYAEVERIRRRTEEQLAIQRDQVARELRGELECWAVLLAEKLLGQPLTDQAGMPPTIARFLADPARTPTGKDAKQQTRQWDSDRTSEDHGHTSN